MFEPVGLRLFHRQFGSDRFSIGVVMHTRRDLALFSDGTGGAVRVVCKSR